MVPVVHKRWIKPLIHLLVVAQLLLAVPANAGARTDATNESGQPCDTMMQTTAQGECPCCPEGVASMKDCLASCTLAAATVATCVSRDSAPAPAIRPASANAPPFKSFSAPPLKPPPIH
jgi:hypothetical protein